MARSHHRDPVYIRAAAILRRDAYADPDTQCWRCLRKLHECGPNGDGTHRNGKPATWHAGHTIDGDNTAPLAPECSPCNTSHGAAAGNRARNRHTEDW